MSWHNPRVLLIWLMPRRRTCYVGVAMTMMVLVSLNVVHRVTLPSPRRRPWESSGDTNWDPSGLSDLHPLRAGKDPNELANDADPELPDYNLMLQELDKKYLAKIDVLQHEVSDLENQLREVKSRLGGKGLLPDTARDVSGDVIGDANRKSKEGHIPDRARDFSRDVIDDASNEATEKRKVSHHPKDMARDAFWWPRDDFNDLQDDIQRLVLNNTNGTTSGKVKANTNHRLKFHYKGTASQHRSDYASFMASNILQLHIQEPQMFSSEYEIPTYLWINGTHVLDPDAGGGTLNIVRISGSQRTALNPVLDRASIVANSYSGNATGQTLAVRLVSGIYKTVASLGSSYELFYEETPKGDEYGSRKWRITLSRPYAPIGPIQIEENIEVSVPLVKVIVTISDDSMGLLERFLDIYKMSMARERNVVLLVAYVGSNALSSINATLVKSGLSRGSLELIHVKGGSPNLRAQGRILTASSSGSDHDPLLLFLDPDVAIHPWTVKRCRMHTQRDQRVYYPIAFSLYNPHIIYETIYREKIPSQQARLRTEKNKGFWDRTYFGTYSIYRSDFLKVGSATESPTLDDLYDVETFGKYQQRGLEVIRVPDQHVFRMWHTMKCDPGLEDDSYNYCMKQRILHEAAHTHIGFLVFRDEIDMKRDHH